MKYLLRERLQESQPFLVRCKELLNQVFQSKPEPAPGSLDDFAAGLSPETLLKLQRVQGGLQTQWESAASISCKPIQGQSVWMQAPKHTVLVTRPKIRVQLRRTEEPVQMAPVQKPAEVRGLDDIFPERVTSFFGDEKQKPRQTKTAGSVVIDYRIVKEEPKPVVEEVQPAKPLFNGFDESWRQKVRWPITTKTKRQIPVGKAPEMLPQQPRLQAPALSMKMNVKEPLVSWSATFWSMMSTKITETLAQMKPVLVALEEEQPYVEPDMIPAPISAMPARTIQPALYDSLKPTWHVKPLHQQSTALEMKAITGMDVREFQPVPKKMMPKEQPVSEAVEEQAVMPPPEIEMPVQRLDATLLVSRYRKPFSQVSKGSTSKPVVDQTPMVTPVVSKKADPNSQENHLDYMWRNNQILAKSIMNLADQYFQQAALEESVNF